MGMEEPIDLSKQANHITTPNQLMEDYEIKLAVIWLGQCICISPDMEPLHDPNSLSLTILLAFLNT
jgi:hypothetical protein